MAAVFPYDATLLAAVQPVPQSVAEVQQILEAIDATCIDGDGLKWFNWLYLQVTNAVAQRVRLGGFHDPAWLAALDVQFARLYFSALAASLSGGAPAECWQVLFASRAQAAIARIQFALAGINAHINHDLPVAIVANCLATGTTPDPTGIHCADYTALNSTLDTLIEAAKQTLHVRLLGDELPPVSHLEDTIAAWSVSAARANAWRNAEYLWPVYGIDAVRTGFLDMLDGFTTVIGKGLLVPVV
jgi:hypothetical protein